MGLTPGHQHLENVPRCQVLLCAARVEKPGRECPRSNGSEALGCLLLRPQWFCLVGVCPTDSAAWTQDPEGPRMDLSSPSRPQNETVSDSLQAAGISVASPSRVRAVMWRAGVSASLGGWGAEGVGSPAAPTGWGQDSHHPSPPPALPCDYSTSLLDVPAPSPIRPPTRLQSP